MSFPYFLPLFFFLNLFGSLPPPPRDIKLLQKFWAMLFFTTIHSSPIAWYHCFLLFRTQSSTHMVYTCWQHLHKVVNVSPEWFHWETFPILLSIFCTMARLTPVASKLRSYVRMLALRHPNQDTSLMAPITLKCCTWNDKGLPTTVYPNRYLAHEKLYYQLEARGTWRKA